MEKKNVYIMSGCRTPIGKYGGSLKNVTAHELGTIVVKEAMKRANVPGEMVNEVMLGEVRQSTEASNIARLVALEAGLPETVPGFTVNRLCASAMQAIYSGCQQIWLNEADVIVAGGGKDAKITEILAGYINNDLHLYRGLNRRKKG